MKKISGFLLMTCMLLFTLFCKKELLEVKNENQYSDATYFKTRPQFNEAVISTYSTFLHQGMYSREYYFIFDLMGNDAEKDAPLLGDALQLSDFSFGSSNSLISQLWGSLYRMVFRANLVLDKTAQWNPTDSADVAAKKQFIGEAQFLRAWAYFNLVNAWGRVPLKLTYDQLPQSSVPRSSVEDVWKAVEKDLTDAVANLPVTNAERGRAGRGAAIALLGKSLLFQKKYAEAATQLELLTKAPYAYKINPSFDNQFSESNGNSVETIFDIPHKWTDWSIGNQYYMFGGQEAWGGKTTHTGRAQEYGFNDWRNVIVSDALVQSFKYPDPVTGLAYVDPRANLTFYGDAPSGGDVDYCNTCAEGVISYPYNASNGFRWRKYQPYEGLKAIGRPQSNINSQVIRYADVLLMLAESYILSIGAQANARTILRRERQMELAGEQTRWFDLVRWGVAKQTINAEKQIQIEKQPFQDKHVLLPIPQAEKNTNPVLAADVANEWN